MKFIKPALTALALATAAFSADAVIAKRGVMTVTRPDGTTLRIMKTGDEAMHFTTTEDGILLHEANGVYTYGRMTDRGVVSTGVIARDLDVRDAADTENATRLADIDMAAMAKKLNVAERRTQSYLRPTETQGVTPQKAPARKVAQSGVGLTSSTFPTKGSTKGLIVLIQYKDVKFTHPNPAQYFNDMINKHGFNEYGGTGSALDYFTEQSGGVFTPDFDVYGPVTLNGNRSTYGGNDSNGNDRNPEGMVVQACQMLDATVDFSQYDTDGDGKIDNVYVIYAGQGEASYGPAESVWPHSFDVTYGGYNVYLDGVKLGHYACSNEWEQNRPDGIGTFVHEFSHVMGLPDLYDTNGQGLTCTPGEYSALDYGPYNNNGCTPPNYGAYEKNALGWIDPIILDQAETVTLDPISSGQFGLIPTSSNNEFFLLENRQQTGWDAYIPGHGMLIWHLDYNANVFASNTVNNKKSHQYCDIEEANNQANNSSASAMAGWPFPGTTGKTEFTSSTTPAMRTWAGVNINIPVTNIEESSDGVITFDVLGGGTRLGVPQPSAEAPAAGDRHFVATWPHIDGATDYMVTVYAANNGDGGSTTVGFDGSKVPEGWTSSKTNPSFYTSSGNYGESSPSLKMDTNGQTLTSPVFPGDINHITFWVKGNGSNMTSKFWVLLNEDGKYENGYSYQMSGNVWSGYGEITAEDLPAGIRQIQFYLEKKVGNAALDDIVIEYGSTDVMLPDYNAVKTGGVNSLRVDKLIDGRTKYYFTVTAMNDKQRSSASEPVYVDVQGMSGVENIAADADNEAPVRYYNLQGAPVSNPAPGAVYIRVQGDKATKVAL